MIQTLSKKRVLKYLIIMVASLCALFIIALVVLYIMPHRSQQLQQASTETFSYKEAVKQISAQQKKDRAQKSFEEGCETQSYLHDKKVARTVVLFHGIVACPKQYSTVAKAFFDAGYNVYVPLAPEHGTTNNPEATSDVTLNSLTRYVGDSYSVATGLGDEIGFVGLSGGGALATWGAQYIDGVSRLLVLSPFYRTTQQAAPDWQYPFLLSLYGMNLAPDRQVQDFSIRALTKYLILVENYREDLKAPHLKHVAVITSANDKDIDLDLAHRIPSTLAKNSSASFQHTRLAPELGIGHDMLSPEQSAVKKHQKQLNNLYLSFYENRPPAKEL